MKPRPVVHLLFLITLVASLLVPAIDAFAGGKRSGGPVSVRGYFRKDGTYVRPHVRSAPDGSPYNNFSFPGNYNPNTGEITPGDPEKYLERYYQRKGGSVPALSAPSVAPATPPATTSPAPSYLVPAAPPTSTAPGGPAHVTPLPDAADGNSSFREAIERIRLKYGTAFATHTSLSELLAFEGRIDAARQEIAGRIGQKHGINIRSDSASLLDLWTMESKLDAAVPPTRGVKAPGVLREVVQVPTHPTGSELAVAVSPVPKETNKCPVPSAPSVAILARSGQRVGEVFDSDFRSGKCFYLIQREEGVLWAVEASRIRVEPVQTPALSSR